MAPEDISSFTVILLIVVYSIQLTTCLKAVEISDACSTPQASRVTLSYGTCGELVSSQIQKDASPPQVKYSMTEDSAQDAQYTVVMVDPDAPGQSHARYWRHWVVANIPGKDLRDGKLAKGLTLTKYHPPTPPAGTGVHRYQFFIYRQSRSLAKGVLGERAGWDLENFVESNDLGQVIASYQYLAEHPSQSEK